MSAPDNVESGTVADFGREWARFDQAALAADETAAMFEPKDAAGFDAGCGSGRWAALAAPPEPALG